MYSVSLLPYEYRMMHQKARKKDISLLLAILVMGILAAVYFILTFSAYAKAQTLKELEAQNADVEMQSAKLEGLLELNAEVTGLLTQTSAAIGSIPEWNKLIKTLGNSVPETVNIININAKYTTDSKQCILNGKAADYKSVAEWISSLEKLDEIGEVRCKTSANEGKSVLFEISIELMSGRGYMLPMEVIEK